MVPMGYQKTIVLLPSASFLAIIPLSFSSAADSAGQLIALIIATLYHTAAQILNNLAIKVFTIKKICVIIKL